jgi:tRNA (guanine-N7-)-methyltransferase
VSRPSLRRALVRAGLEPAAKKPGKKDTRNRGVAPSPRIFLPGETVSADPGPVDLVALFGRSAPVELEIGTGRARFLLAEAARQPGRSFLGAEVENDYARIAQARADALGLANLLVACLDGKAFVLSRLALASLDALHVYFPDPWPKKRHRKRRVVDPEFTAAAARALRPGALLKVASDHADYFSAIVETLSAEPLLRALSPDEQGEWTTGTSYELKFLAQGRPIYKGIWARRP